MDDDSFRVTWERKIFASHRGTAVERRSGIARRLAALGSAAWPAIAEGN
jgi:hypothetical protein